MANEVEANVSDMPAWICPPNGVTKFRHSRPVAHIIATDSPTQNLDEFGSSRGRPIICRRSSKLDFQTHQPIDFSPISGVQL